MSKWRFENMDASESAFVSKELEAIRERTYDVKYAQLKGRQFVPVDNSVNTGASVVTYKQFDSVGIAKMLADYGDDLPRADVFANEFTTPVRGLGSSYGFSIQELRAAQFAGMPLEQRKANACRQAIEQKIDSIAQVGDSKHGLLGLLNQPNALSYTVLSDGTGSSPNWEDKTPDQIARDMHEISRFIPESTKDVERPDTLLLPLTSFGLVSTVRMADGSDTTILDFFLRTSPYITAVESWYALETAGAGGVKRMVAYRRDPDALQLIIPQEFEQLAPENRSLEVVTACHARCGGVVAYYPLSIAYGDDI